MKLLWRKCTLRIHSISTISHLIVEVKSDRPNYSSQSKLHSRCKRVDLPISCHSRSIPIQFHQSNSHTIARGVLYFQIKPIIQRRFSRTLPRIEDQSKLPAPCETRNFIYELNLIESLPGKQDCQETSRISIQSYIPTK